MTARTALVTGANRGSGLAIATALHEAGWRVLALNRTPAGLPWLRERVVDLGRPGEVAAAVDELLAELADEDGGGDGDGLDAVVANAVDRAFGTVATLSPAAWQRALDVNLTSAVALVQAALPRLRAGAGGRIVLMGSHAGSRYFEGGGSYCATKAALKALAEVLLLEEREHGVVTTLVSPGAIANLPGDSSEFKMSTESVGSTVRWLLEAPADLAVGEIELRPARLPGSLPVTGLDRLQAV
ncbi:SDR family oxidoreductase [Streptomyces sp. NBC_00203]|uniref:SDR family oxidoreductase n=1 Tax=Streptomyces sp. NBC_00203 TaxID=2975680 RepID=UPI00324A7AFD